MKDDRERNLFCFTDEIWPNNSEWMYISSIFFEKSALNEITDSLLDARYMTADWRDDTAENWKNVDRDSEHFPKNNEVVKFSELEGSANKMNRKLSKT